MGNYQTLTSDVEPHHPLCHVCLCRGKDDLKNDCIMNDYIMNGCIMNDQIFNLSTHLRLSTISWCSSWEVLRWRARRALSWTFFCLNMEQIRMKVSCKWKILAYRALRLTFAMCVITFCSNNEKSENYHKLIEMTQASPLLGMNSLTHSPLAAAISLKIVKFWKFAKNTPHNHKICVDIE